MKLDRQSLRNDPCDDTHLITQLFELDRSRWIVCNGWFVMGWIVRDGSFAVDRSRWIVRDGSFAMDRSQLNERSQ